MLEFDKLSQKISLTPSFQLPVAKADIHLNSFLDSLDFDVDYDRDDYATIYISDTIHKLLEISMGAEFRLLKNLDLGAIYAHYASPYYKRNTYALSANLGIRNAFSLSPTLMFRGNETLWACSAAFRFGPLQFHMAVNDLGGIVVPADAQGIGIQMGMSYVFPFALIPKLKNK